MNSIYTDRESRPQNDRDRYSEKLLVRKERKNMTKRMSAENPAPWSPTFYGVNRKERLENHLTEVSDDSLPFSEVVNGGAEVEEPEDVWKRRNGRRN